MRDESEHLGEATEILVPAILSETGRGLRFLIVLRAARNDVRYAATLRPCSDAVDVERSCWLRLELHHPQCLPGKIRLFQQLPVGLADFRVNRIGCQVHQRPENKGMLENFITG